MQKISPYDGMPQNYCTKCFKALLACSSFRRLCAVSAQQLQSILRDRIKKDTTTNKSQHIEQAPNKVQHVEQRSVIMELEIEQLDVNEMASEADNSADIFDSVDTPAVNDANNTCEESYIYYKLDGDNADSDNALDFESNYEILSNSEYISDGQPNEATNFEDGNDILDHSIEENPEALNAYLYDGDILDDNSYYSIEYDNAIEDSITKKEEDNASVDNPDVITIEEIKIEQSDDDGDDNDLGRTNDTELIANNSKIKPEPKSRPTRSKSAATTSTAPTPNTKRKAKNNTSKTNGEKELCPDCGGFFISLKNHLQTHRDKNRRKCYTCDQCDAKFVNKASFVGHVNKHNNLTPFQCPKCPRKFHGKGNLRMHMNSHSAVNRYACTECDKAFRYSHMLALHRRSHTLERVYFCEFCTYCSVNRENYKNHMMNHTGVYRFNCEKCMKGFKKKIYYLRHMKTHDGEQELVE